MIGSQEDGTTLSMHYYSGEGPGVGLTWRSVFDLTTMIEGQSEVWFRSVKCSNVSPVHWKLYFWKSDMSEALILTISIPLLLIPPVTHQVAGLSSSLPCRVYG